MPDPPVMLLGCINLLGLLVHFMVGTVAGRITVW